ncbi:MAG: hypothetical protein Q8N70_08675, partial [Deltaproteobacteria bacterium]|nr:hypothetical protein [Deltaproteobacteria bacterium]
IIKVTSMDRERFMQKLSEYQIGYGIHFPAGHRLTPIFAERIWYNIFFGASRPDSTKMGPLRTHG